MSVAPSSPEADEDIVGIDALMNSITPYLRVHLSRSPRRLWVLWPITVLGVLPIARGRLDVQPGEIDDLRLAPVFFPSRLIVAIVLAGLLWVGDLPGWAGAVLAIFALVLVLLSYVLALQVSASSGSATIPVCFLERRRVRQFLAGVPVPGGRQP